MRTKWNALMNFLIKSKHHRATSRYYYLSHRSIRRIAVMHRRLTNNIKNSSARKPHSFISMLYILIKKKNKIKNPKEIGDTYFVRVFNCYRKEENNEMEFRVFPPRHLALNMAVGFSPTSNIYIFHE